MVQVGGCSVGGVNAEFSRNSLFGVLANCLVFSSQYSPPLIE